MKNKIITSILICVATFISADELRQKGPEYGLGKHRYRTVEDMRANAVGIVISELIKSNYIYRVKSTDQGGLVVSRDSIQSNGKSENLFEFNNNLVSETPGNEVGTWLVDVFDGDHQISLLLSVSTGYIYIKITDDLTKYKNDSLILPPAGVGKGKWNVIQRTFSSTTFGSKFEVFSHKSKIRKINLHSLDIVQVEFFDADHSNLFDCRGEFMKKDGIIMDNEKLYNPSVFSANAIANFRDAEKSDAEMESMKKWVNGREGGKERVIQEIKRFSHEPKAADMISQIEKAMSAK